MLIDLSVYLCDLSCSHLRILLMHLYLLLFLLDLIEHRADCKIYFPENSFEKGAQYHHYHYVLHREEKHNRCVEIRVAP